ncbi:collagen-like domain-containing protein [Sphingobacterium chuzhouense]|uniref:Collagen triple helix repeat (20 copies) n=1 Tax=Sphingobacterium chuzhouense TaxID=1742264 RepID=A0ABR7XM82_9SPHI|nr:hypothetical protein [Sphingobacterium chuzhouense]MBD1420271.1 hypothetical protein [Sphingobacterium chuzhouense]
MKTFNINISKLLFVGMTCVLFIVTSCKKGDIGPEGPQGEQGIRGEKGEDGTTIYNGTVVPPADLGRVGDFYFRTSNSNFYGPKTAEGWGTPTSLRGPTGAAGAKILSGTTVPAANVGAVGDFYLRTSNAALYGPKAASGWPTTFVNLRGPKGSAGTANVIYSGWMSFPQAERDTLIDGTNLKVNHIAASPLTQTIIDNGMIQVYMRFGTTVLTLPYTSRAGARPNTVSFVPRAGRLLLTRFTHDNTQPYLGFGTVQFRYVLIPGGVRANANIDLKDYNQVKRVFQIPD